MLQPARKASGGGGAAKAIVTDYYGPRRRLQSQQRDGDRLVRRAEGHALPQRGAYPCRRLRPYRHRRLRAAPPLDDRLLRTPLGRRRGGAAHPADRRQRRGARPPRREWPSSIPSDNPLARLHVSCIPFTRSLIRHQRLAVMQSVITISLLSSTASQGLRYRSVHLHTLHHVAGDRKRTRVSAFTASLFLTSCTRSLLEMTLHSWHHIPRKHR